MLRSPNSLAVLRTRAVIKRGITIPLPDARSRRDRPVDNLWITLWITDPGGILCEICPFWPSENSPMCQPCGSDHFPRTLRCRNTAHIATYPGRLRAFGHPWGKGDGHFIPGDPLAGRADAIDGPVVMAAGAGAVRHGPVLPGSISPPVPSRRTVAVRSQRAEDPRTAFALARRSPGSRHAI